MRVNEDSHLIFPLDDRWRHASSPWDVNEALSGTSHGPRFLASSFLLLTTVASSCYPGRTRTLHAVRNCSRLQGDRACWMPACIQHRLVQVKLVERGSRASSLLFSYTNRMRGARIIAEEVANLRSCNRPLCVFSPRIICKIWKFFEFVWIEVNGGEKYLHVHKREDGVLLRINRRKWKNEWKRIEGFLNSCAMARDLFFFIPIFSLNASEFSHRVKSFRKLESTLARLRHARIPFRGCGKLGIEKGYLNLRKESVEYSVLDKTPTNQN